MSASDPTRIDRSGDERRGRLPRGAGVVSRLMRRLLVLFALLGLLISPAAAAAAQRACAQAGPAMAGMMMAAPATDHATSDAPDPCCDHSQKTMDGKACAQACATMCGVTAALPTAAVYLAPRLKIGVLAETVLPLKPQPPRRAERPPRSLV
jgi:hypothetical protein